MGKLVLIVVVVAGIAAGLYFGGIIKFNSQGVEVKQDLVQEASVYDQASSAFFKNQWNEALALYQRAIKENPNDARNAEARFRIGKCLEDGKQLKEALAAYKEFMEKHPDADKKLREQANKRIEYLGAQLGSK